MPFGFPSDTAFGFAGILSKRRISWRVGDVGRLACFMIFMVMTADISGVFTSEGASVGCNARLLLSAYPVLLVRGRPRAVVRQCVVMNAPVQVFAIV